MIYADLHCDTATLMYDKQLNFNSKIHLNHKALKAYDILYQCFAIFFNDTVKNGGMEYFEKVLAYFLPLVKEEKNIVPFITIEGGDVLEGRLENLDRLREAGVRIFGLVWNGENDLAVGAQTNNAEGLRPLGIKCVQRLEELNILPDVSHLSDKGFFDVVENCKGRFVATHSNSRKIYPNLRNLTDEQIDIIISRDGLIGLNLYPPFVAENAHIKDVLKHVDYFLQRGAENTLCFGCDLDGIDKTPHGFSSVADVKKIIKLIKKLYGEEIAEKITYKNALRILGGEVK
ncbi:MAG: hypothetical protein DBX47_03500 [Clostridiales bacterium]|nr:MAG: hypothetical protein DBX47_03500 [Clostridiales bacterium]